ncbi:hypothetical protein M0R89_19015 (plasmid) [Halorussus limi]|uniref:Uncharacterized protein n=1 Tax=Halorussus limi TaxID=2938695 RepID=A0A8U0HZU2_9EURY|nr:hypothetical protein [Halorussus limi]UPV76625.1 hypothetical protein M0R89_19015 [Halorussus limi]
MPSEIDSETSVSTMTIAELTEEIRHLYTEVQGLQGDLEDQQATIDRQKTVIEELRSDLQSERQARKQTEQDSTIEEITQESNANAGRTDAYNSHSQEDTTQSFDHPEEDSQYVDRIEELESALTAKDEQISTLENRVEDLEAHQTSHEKRLDALGMGIESANDDIADLEDSVNTGDSSSTTSDQQPTDEWTPIERLATIGEDALDDHVTASDRRAVVLFEHWEEWSTTTPKGQLLKTADSLKSLLSTACDERLAWKQVYRACRRLEQLSQGTVTFFDHDRHGRMLKQHDAFLSKHTSTQRVTASSAHT